MKKILFCGASGYFNLGDNAYKTLFEKFLGEDFELIFTHPYPDPALVRIADYVVIGGGGLIYDNKTPHFNYMSQYLQTAIEAGKPFSFISCGVQPMMKVGDFSQVGEWWKQMERWRPYLNKADIVTVRGTKDAEIIKQIAPEANVEYYPDLVYLMQPSKYHFFDHRADHVVFIPTKTDGQSQEFQQQWKEHAHMGKKRLILTMAREEQDLGMTLAAKINSSRGLNEFLDVTPEEACRIITDCTKVVTCRYHGLVMAYAQNKAVKSCDRRYKSVFEKKPVNKNMAIRHIEKLKIQLQKIDN